jgi:hypothetical protein
MNWHLDQKRVSNYQQTCYVGWSKGHVHLICHFNNFSFYFALIPLVLSLSDLSFSLALSLIVFLACSLSSLQLSLSLPYLPLGLSSIVMVVHQLSTFGTSWSCYGRTQLGGDTQPEPEVDKKISTVHPRPVSLLHWSGKGMPWLWLDSKHSCPLDSLWAPYDLLRHSSLLSDS